MLGRATTPHMVHTSMHNIQQRTMVLAPRPPDTIIWEQLRPLLAIVCPRGVRERRFSPQIDQDRALRGQDPTAPERLFG